MTVGEASQLVSAVTSVITLLLGIIAYFILHINIEIIKRETNGVRQEEIKLAKEVRQEEIKLAKEIGRLEERSSDPTKS
jgi:amino acid permease